MGDLHRRLIAFDLDGTLVDSRRDLAESANELVVELGGAPLSEDTVAGMVGEGARVLVRRVLVAAGVGDARTAVARFLDIYDRRLLNHTILYDGVADAVRLAHGRARLAVLTNKPEAPSLRILDALGVRALFDDVVGGDNPLGRKPDPAGLLALMRRAGAAPDTTLMVGDSGIDLETAQRAGVRCCLVSFGFGYASVRRERLTGDEWIAADAASLGDIIEHFLTGPSAGG